MDAAQSAELRHLIGLFKLVDEAGFETLQKQLGPIPLGGMLGVRKQPSEATRALTPLETCILAAAALQRMRLAAEPVIALVKRRLITANRLGLFGEVVGALAAAGVISALWGQPAKDAIGHTTAIVMAMLSFSGAVLALVSRYLRRDSSGAEGSLTNAHRKLVDSSWEADVLSAKLDLVAAKGAVAASSPDAKLMIERAEKLAAELFRSMTDLGVTVGA